MNYQRLLWLALIFAYSVVCGIVYLCVYYCIIFGLDLLSGALWFAVLVTVATFGVYWSVWKKIDRREI
jgi:O-antigen/teichoic acid export membrane protein